MCARFAEPGAGHPDNVEPIHRQDVTCDYCGKLDISVRQYGAATWLCAKCRARDLARWDEMVGEYVA
jgi:ribosomal protein L37AE/L43A